MLVRVMMKTEAISSSKEDGVSISLYSHEINNKQNYGRGKENWYLKVDIGERLLGWT